MGLEMDVLIPFLVAAGLLILVGLVGEASARDCVARRLCLCDIAWSGLLWRCQSLIDPHVSHGIAGGVA